MVRFFIAIPLTLATAASECGPTMKDVDCVVDSDLLYMPALTSPEECCALCSETDQCKAFTYRSESQECWLKRDCSETAEGLGLVSARLEPECPAEVLTNVDCLVDSDLHHHFEVTTAEACCDLCSRSKHCKAFTHREASAECWLKRGCQDLVPGPGLTSAVLASTTTTTTSTSTTWTPSQALTLHALHHNPHWECTDDEACRQEEYALLERLMKKHHVDFTSLIMGGNYSSARWHVVTAQSHVDKAAIIWDDHKWELRKALQTEFVEDRAAMLARFRLRSNHALSVVVASLHFPHRGEPAAFDVMLQGMADRIQEVAAAHTSSVLVMADANLNSEELCSADLAMRLGLGASQSTEPLPTCCADGDFGLSFDRIFANFGSEFKTLVDTEYRQLSAELTQAPSWAAGVKKPGMDATAAYHHPVLARFTVEQTPAVMSV